jgi:glycosyltransferase involved in cell wall biosynthesis
MDNLISQTNVANPLVQTSKRSDEEAAAKIEKTRVVMVGMSLTKTRGGISTLIKEVLDSEIQNDLAITYIESQAEDYQGVKKLLLAIKAVFLFICQVVRQNPALVYVHVGSNASLYREPAFIVLGKALGKKVVGHFHAGDVEEYLGKQSQAGQWFIKKAISLSDKIIACSHESAEKLQKLIGERQIFVIHNAISTKPFAFSPERLAERQGIVRLLFVGAMGKLKGEQDLADAVKVLIEKHPNLRVSFLGYGGENLKEYCQQIGITDFIEHFGPVGLDERIKFFETADVFVLPTYAEAMPMSVIEAMAAGLPTVTTNVGGIPEVITDGEEGFLINPGNNSELAEKISVLLENKALRVAMAQKAQDKACEKLDFDLYTAKLRSLINELIEEN